MSKKVFKTEKMLSRQRIAEHIRDIANSMDDGNLELDSGKEKISLQPPEEAEFEIEVEEDSSGEISLEIEIEWSSEDSGELHIN
jgi:amphi-Trp domain-containing protein